jgi:hypothetical protein
MLHNIYFIHVNVRYKFLESILMIYIEYFIQKFCN